MRKTKVIKIDDREITVRELRVKDIHSIVQTADRLEGDTLKAIEEYLPMATDLTIADLEEMAPSELKLIWEAFKEVNADFLALAEAVGLGKAILETMRRHLSEAFAGLSNEAM